MGSSSSAMGCVRPRMEEENPTSLPRIRHRRAGGFRQRHRTGGRVRKDSILSTSELLRSSADDISDVASSAAVSPRKPATLTKDEVMMGKERLGFGRGGEKIVGEMEEDFLGSPSFRYYFKDPIDEEVIIEKKIEDESQKDDSLMSSNSNEDSRSKLQNNVKGKRPRSKKKKKKKGTNGGCNLLTARGSYNHDHHHTSLARVAPIE